MEYDKRFNKCMIGVAGIQRENGPKAILEKNNGLEFSKIDEGHMDIKNSVKPRQENYKTKHIQEHDSQTTKSQKQRKP